MRAAPLPRCLCALLASWAWACEPATGQVGQTAGLDRQAGARRLSAEEVALTIFEARTGLAKTWNDYGWSKRTIAAGNPAVVDFSGYGGWVLASREMKPAFGGLLLRMRASPAAKDFLEVRLGSGRDEVFPAVRVGPEHRVDAAGGWTEILLPMRELNPQSAPFDRFRLFAWRNVSAAGTEIERIALTAPPRGSVPKEPSTPARPTASEVDCTAPGTAISPLIYGLAARRPDGAGVDHGWDTGTTARRWGGNPTSRFNWELGNAWNTGDDWFFRNVSIGVGRVDDQVLALGLQHHAATALTVPTIGWVAKDTTSYSFPVSVFGSQDQVAPELSDAGNGRRGQKDLAPGPPSRTSVPAPPEFIGRWIADIRERDKGRGRSLHMVILDNEPALWNSTHRDVHPEPVGYDELLERLIAYGTAVRKADPEVVIAGPASWGWPEYHYSAKDTAAGYLLRPDRRAHGDEPLLPWLLGKLREHREKTGVRILDVVDVHFYPQAKGVGIGTKGATDAATAALRLRSTRALWDPLYIDESWIGEPVRLIPRLRDWIKKKDPGLGISIGEYNFGAEEHMSGGLALAEALGHFGAEGVTSAFYWTSPPRNSPAFHAFRAFRNFDGRGGRFLDVSLPVRADGDVSLFASRDPGRTRLVVVLLNRSASTPAALTLHARGCRLQGPVRSFAYAGGEAGLSERPALQPQRASTVELVLPPWSMTVLESAATPMEKERP